MGRTDLVYLVRPGEDNEELRFSLRSVVANLPHRKVWLVGSCPSWVTGVEKVILPPLPDKFDNQFQSLQAACDDERITEDFVLMNDDFFVKSPIDGVPVLHGGTVREKVAWFLERGKKVEAPYLVGMRNTLAEVESWGFVDPLTYELHSPLPMNRHRVGAMLRASTARPFLWQTAYAAVADTVGSFGLDAKNATAQFETDAQFDSFPSPFLSSYDGSFKHGSVGRYVRSLFPTPCRYESP